MNKCLAQFIVLILFLLYNLNSSYAQSPSSDNKNTGTYFYQKGKEVLRNGDTDSMTYYWNKALSAFRKNNDIEGLYNCYFGYSSIYMQLGQLEKAMIYSDSTFLIAALSKEDPESYKDYLTYAHYRRGNLYNLSYDYKLAIDAYQNAIDYEMAKEMPDSNHLSRTWNNLSLLYRNAGDYQKAMVGYEHALEFGESIKWSVKAAILNNIGQISFDEEKYDQAGQYFIKAYHLFVDGIEKNAKEPTINEVENYVNVCNNLGKTYLKLKLNKQASKFLDRSLKIQKEYQFDRVQYLSNRYLGQLSLLEGKSEKGISYLHKSITLANEQFKTPSRDIGACYYVLGKVYMGKGDIAAALDNLSAARKAMCRSLPSEQRLPNNPEDVLGEVTMLKVLALEGEALWERYNQDHQPGDLQRGMDNFEFMHRLIVHMRRSYLSQESKQFLATQVHSAYGTAIRVARALFLETGNNHYADAALGFMESSKSMILLESLAANEARMFTRLRANARGKALLEQEATLKTSIATYKRLIFEAGTDKAASEETLKKWNQRLFAANQDFEAVQSALGKEFPEYFALKYDTEVASIENVRQQILQKGELLLEFYMDDAAIITCAIGSDFIDITETPLLPEELKQINIFLEQVSNFSFYKEASVAYSKFCQASFSTYQLLLKNMLDKYPGTIEQLVIIPDGVLNFIPFSALLTSLPNDAQSANYSPDHLNYLLKDYTLRYAYSVKRQLFYQAITTRPKANAWFAGFAPSFAEAIDNTPIRSCATDQLFDLKYTRQEVSRISEKLNGKTFLGEKASSEIFQQVAADYRILHLATHACVNTTDPLYGKIYFGPSDYLYTLDLYNLDLRAELVVLSACETGLGSIIQGEGVLSLARGIAYGGCPSTLTSLWSISDQTTAEIMVQYYVELLQEKNKSEALRQAQLSFLQNQKSAYQHPVYWAGFAQIGKDDPISLANNFSSFKWILIVSSLLLVAMLFYFFWLKS
ncbi:MAG: hypothetical protein DHS20C18_42890 [Saprospiraceae bacterium]|nr:MAG: hypothetical protein DHS20C18_42890 [Saprospiraceae bacterium]